MANSIWDYINEKMNNESMNDYTIYETNDGHKYGYADVEDDSSKVFLCGMRYMLDIISDYDSAIKNCPEDLESVKGIVEDVRKTAIENAVYYGDCWLLSAINDILYRQAQASDDNEKEDE